MGNVTLIILKVYEIKYITAKMLMRGNAIQFHDTVTP